jgi:PhnB protein
MQLNAYLNFKGQTEEAFRLYERTLGATIEFALLEDGQAADLTTKTPWGKKVLHGRINIGGQTVMASDCPPDRFATPQGFSLNLGFREAAEAERVFAALSQGGQVQMPIQETFWAHRFGFATDRFGTPWMINCEKARVEVENMYPCKTADVAAAV